MTSHTQPSKGIFGIAKRDRNLRQCFNGRLLYACGLIALSQVNFGADQSAFSNTQAMPAFQRQFGTLNHATGKYHIDTVTLSLLNSLTYIGFAFGLVTGNILSRRFGRRITMFIMSLWALVAAIILNTAKHMPQMIAGRIIAYVYIGFELALVPVLQSELVPAEVRGLVVGTYQLGIMFGSLFMSIICRGTSELHGNPSWHIPLGLFFVIPSILAVGVWWIPESPRWLLTRNRDEEALGSLRLLRQYSYTEEAIQAEFNEIKSSINVTVEKGSFKEIFQGTNLKRTLITLGVNIFLQLTGQNFASVYGTIFISSLNTVNPFTMSCVNVAIGIAIVLLSQFLTDRTGRVPLMVIGAIVQTCSLMVMGGLGTAANPSDAIKSGIVAMMTLFQAGFCCGWAPLSHVVAAEVPTTRLRDATYAFGAVFNIAIQFAVSFSTPYLLNEPYAALGSKVGFIFGSTAFCAVLFSMFCIPECGGKTLEEIDQLFIHEVPIRKFKSTRVPDFLDVYEKEVGVKQVETEKAGAMEVAHTEDVA